MFSYCFIIVVSCCYELLLLVVVFGSSKGRKEIFASFVLDMFPHTLFVSYYSVSLSFFSALLLFVFFSLLEEFGYRYLIKLLSLQGSSASKFSSLKFVVIFSFSIEKTQWCNPIG